MDEKWLAKVATKHKQEVLLSSCSPSNGRFADFNSHTQQMKCPFRFYTETAVSNYNGKTDFYTDSKPYNNEMGAGIVGENVNLKAKSATVNVVRLSDFVLNVVAQRRVPEPKQVPICLQNFLSPSEICMMIVKSSTRLGESHFLSSYV